MGKYDPLHTHLNRQTRDRVSMTMREVEAVISDSLPAGAFSSRQWWANGSLVQAKAWQGAGFVVESVDFSGQKVSFRRGQAQRRRSSGRVPEELRKLKWPDWEVLQTLSERRPVFHSEADFQFELAWELRNRGWADVRLERPHRLTSGVQYLDVEAVDRQGAVWAIELKYWTKELVGDVNGEDFALKTQSAHDLNRYALFKDIHRVETLIRERRVAKGRVIAITNDTAYLKEGRPGTLDEDFRLTEGRLVHGGLEWARETNTTKGLPGLDLYGRYHMSWTPFSRTKGLKNGGFWVLDIVVEEHWPWPPP